MTVPLILAAIWAICGIAAVALFVHEALSGRWTWRDQRALERHAARERIRAYAQEMAAREATRPHTNRIDKWN